MGDLFLNKYRIDSTRASWHDYNGGVYFVTICTAYKQCHFGYIDNGNMILNVLGWFVYDNLQYADHHYRYLDIPLFVVMPNHVHAIVYVTNDNGMTKSRLDDTRHNKGLLSVGIGGIKSAISAYAHRNNCNFAWQTRFHDHIIRNQEEMNRIADYIENNPLNWISDCFYNQKK